MFVNEKFYKDPKLANVNDLFFSGSKIQETQNPVGLNVTVVNVNNLAGLNTVGISLAHIDFALGDLNPPHTHPCATESLVVL